MRGISESAWHLSKCLKCQHTLIYCTGSLRLRDSKYAPILKLMNEAAGAGHEVITLDISTLKVLNSSGINTLSKFVIGM